jgi:hypothetical protein
MTFYAYGQSARGYNFMVTVEAVNRAAAVIEFYKHNPGAYLEKMLDR